MTLNRSMTPLTFSASLLLVAAYATSSDARPHAQQPTQKESVYYHSDSNSMRDSSCFSGLPALYACSVNGG